MILANLPQRGTDDYGSGDFGAPRGNRIHNGVDYVCFPGTEILSQADGVVTKLGYCYSDDLSYRYVEVTDATGLEHRMFYIEPCVEEGQPVVADVTPLGIAQDICRRYPPTQKKPRGMLSHVHYEVRKDGEYFNPEDFNISHRRGPVSPD